MLLSFAARKAVSSKTHVGVWGAAAAAAAAGAAASLAASQSTALSSLDEDDDGANKNTIRVQPPSFCRCDGSQMMMLPESNFSVVNQNADTPPPVSLAGGGGGGGQQFSVEDVYEIEQVLGEGAYGMVYKARRKADGAVVALKTMSRSLTGKTDFEREVAALQLLSQPPGHAHVVKLYDLHRDDQNYYLSMELVEGGELLDSLLDHGPYSEALAASFLRQFAEALCYVHSNGLAHADLKPENLLLTKSNELKLADFGCAKSHDMSRKDMHLPAHEFAMGCSFLHMTALGNVFELEKMLQERPHLVTFRDYDFRTSLHLAASEGHVDICRFLVERGAKISPSDRWGGSPLDDAHRHRHPDIVKYLREQGATFGNRKQLPRLIQAASDGDVNEVRALLEFGSVDLDKGDYDGRTSLHLASGEGRLEVVKLLCEAGADVNVVDRWNNRPLDDASSAKTNSKAIMSLLVQYGAKSSKNPALGSKIMATDTDGSKEMSLVGKRTKKKNEEGPSGTIAYSPPEMFEEGAVHTPSSDMWAAGVIMYVVLTGTHPFDKNAELTDEEIRDVIRQLASRKDDHTILMNEWVFDERVEGLSDSCIDLMRQLMHPDPEARPSSDAFLQHPWTQGLTASWTTMGRTHSELKEFWQNRFRAEIEKAFAAKLGKASGEPLSQHDMQEIFGALDLKKNGVLELEEIQTTFRDFGLSDKNIQILFASADLDGSGVISFGEFRTLLASHNRGSSNRGDGQAPLHVKYLQERFKEHVLDKLEYSGAKRDLFDLPKLREVFNAMDLDGNGVLEPHDIRVALRSAGEPDMVISRILAAVDVRQQGKISWADFQQILGVVDGNS